MKGKTYGRLLIIESCGITTAGHIIYRCKCNCGNFCERTGTSIRRSKNSSCGCYTPPAGKESPHWKGVGEISAAWFDQCVIRSANGSKGNRKIKDIDIDMNYIWDLFLQQKRRCVLTNIELTFPKNNGSKAKRESTASLDRIDSDMGYVRGNVQWVHKHINIMKNIYKLPYFLDMCKKVAINAGCEIK